MFNIMLMRKPTQKYGDSKRTQSSILQYSYEMQFSYSNDSARLFSDLWDDKGDAVDGGFSRKALEPYLFEQSG